MNVALFVGPHPDDIELSAGAMVMKHLKKDDHVIYVTFTNCLNLERNKYILTEFKKVRELLEKEGTVVFQTFDLPNTWLHQTSSQREIRTSLERIRDDLKPSIIYSPWDNDINQDHEAVAQEVKRVFRYDSVLFYETLPSCPGFQPNYYLPLTEKEMERKLELCDCYKSQRSKRYYNRDAIIGTMKHHGIACDNEFAEAYHIWRLISK